MVQWPFLQMSRTPTFSLMPWTLDAPLDYDPSSWVSCLPRHSQRHSQRHPKRQRTDIHILCVHVFYCPTSQRPHFAGDGHTKPIHQYLKNIGKGQGFTGSDWTYVGYLSTRQRVGQLLSRCVDQLRGSRTTRHLKRHMNDMGHPFQPARVTHDRPVFLSSKRVPPILAGPILRSSQSRLLPVRNTADCSAPETSGKGEANGEGI